MKLVSALIRIGKYEASESVWHGFDRRWKSRPKTSHVISASMLYGRAWIDAPKSLGAEVGTRLRLTSPDGKTLKGYGEVLQVHRKPDRAEMLLFDIVDRRGNPVTRGDSVSNPLRKGRVATLIGVFDTGPTRSFVASVLRRHGVTIFDQVKVGVDLVIVGNRQIRGRPIEETKAYNAAVVLQCEIVKVEELRRLF